MTGGSFVNLVLTTFSSVPVGHLLLEVGLLVWIIWLLSHKSYRLDEVVKLTEKEKDDLIAEWRPDPLVPEYDSEQVALRRPLVDDKLDHELTLDGKTCLNLTTTNFLALGCHERVEQVACDAVDKYGVGSCGPRGFYGTFDMHLECEDAFAKFMSMEEAVLYSYGFSCIASSIPAYAKRGDVIFVDKAVNFAIQKGLAASRSRIEFFEHNDVVHLSRLLEIQAKKDHENPKKARVTRRFLVVEGIYQNTGLVCPLPQLLRLKWRHKVRLFIDESLSLGVLGATGRGVTEHFGVPVEDVDMIIASLENAVGSTGGVCIGRSYVVDHQRLSGQGYCFSASLPPLLAAAAKEALKIIQEEPDRLSRLRAASKRMFEGLKTLEYLQVSGFDGGPLFHLYLKDSVMPPDRATWARLLERIADDVIARGVAISPARYLDGHETFLPKLSLRITVNCDLTSEEIKNAVSVINEACCSVIKA